MSEPTAESRRRSRLAVAFAAIGALMLVAAWIAWDMLAGRPPADRPAGPSLAESLGGDATGFAQADAPRELAFPADHGAHPDFRTEWWYFTGNLRATDADGGDGEGRRFGYQLTFFRSAVAPPGEVGGGDTHSAWRTRQLWMAHLAVTDVRGERFHAAERRARGALGLAGISETVADGDRLYLSVLDWHLLGDGGGFPWRLQAADGDWAVDLAVEAGKGHVLQGDGGLSRKGGEGTAEASYYYSFPRMPTAGTLTVAGERFAVEGDSWFDREWSSALLAEGRVGWDWFALQLDDGRELVAFRLRGDDDDREAAQRLDYAALVAADGTLTPLDAGRADLRARGHWTSPRTGVRYPSGWRLLLSDAGVHLEIEPWIDDQELDLPMRYWEGAVRVEGVAGEGRVGGVGYVELTGYS